MDKLSKELKSVINEKSVVRIETKRFLIETEKQNIFNSCMHVLQKQKEVQKLFKMKLSSLKTSASEAPQKICELSRRIEKKKL